MKFEVMSRQKARKMSFETIQDDCIIISITDCDAPYNRFAKNPKIKGVCHIKFDDVEFGEQNCITKEDGNTIIAFVDRYRNLVNKIVVHCEAGISRSAGVCAALMLIINGNDNEIFDNPRFYPNMSCYRTVLETYFGSYDQEAAEEKICRNIKLWRIAEGLEEPDSKT